VKAWKFLDTGYNSGIYNMNFDESMLNSFAAEKSQYIFRLYGWSPPAISLGRFQNGAAVLNIEKCAQDNVSVVRRITGGGAIFHDNELTYSIVCSQKALGPASVKDTYKKITGFLISAYKKLGLDARFACELKHGQIFGGKTDFCFSGTEEYDILINSKKIGGNAQTRKRDIIFQHGSIPLSFDIEKAGRYFKRPIRNDDFICLETLIGHISIFELKQMLEETFQEKWF
jgi:lipoate-protein ligase A